MVATLTHELVHPVTNDATSMARDVHALIAKSVAAIVCAQFGVYCPLRSTDDVAHWIDDPAASLIDVVARGTRCRPDTRPGRGGSRGH